MQFTDLQLDKRIERAIEHLGFDQMTEIQQRAIPAAIIGKDLIASSKTGSGKTLAFLLPALQRLLTARALSKKDARILILAPTRELSKQVYQQLRNLLAATPFRSSLIVGGENFNDQAKQLRRQPHVIVATPGRLADHLDKRHLNLVGLELLILDEADRMLDLGFADQLQQINRIANHRKRQTLMFSATLEHTQVEQFAAHLLKQPQRITIGQATEPHSNIEQQLYFSDHLDHKQQMLQQILTDSDIQQLIIFTATRQDTERLATELAAAGWSTAALSGDKNQAARNKIMDQFSRGQQQILITTDIASRGLDLLNVSHVINFDLPKLPEEYIHRIGRTGRAEAKGTAISLVGPKDWQSLQRIQSFLQRKLQVTKLAGCEAKFSGFKAKPDKPVARKANAKPSHSKLKRKTAAPKRNKTFYQGTDGGFGPVKRKPKTDPSAMEE